MAPSQLSVLCAFLSALRHKPRANHTSLLAWLHSTNWHRMKFRAGNRETLAFSMNRLQISVTAVKVNWDWELLSYYHGSWMFPFFWEIAMIGIWGVEGMQREGKLLTLRKSYSRLHISGSFNQKWPSELPRQLWSSWTGLQNIPNLAWKGTSNSSVSCRSGTPGAKPGRDWMPKRTWAQSLFLSLTFKSQICMTERKSYAASLAFQKFV